MTGVLNKTGKPIRMTPIENAECRLAFRYNLKYILTDVAMVEKTAFFLTMIFQKLFLIGFKERDNFLHRIHAKKASTKEGVNDFIAITGQSMCFCLKIFHNYILHKNKIAGYLLPLYAYNKTNLINCT